MGTFAVTPATLRSGTREVGEDRGGASLLAALLGGLSRYFETLPDRSEDVDPALFKRLPVPY